MRVVVAFPWRETPERVAGYQMVRDWYQVNLVNAAMVEVDTDSEVFSLAACRNRAVAVAKDLGADVVVISDADTIPPPTALHDAIEGAAVDGQLHMPYDQCIYAGTDSPPGLANGGVHVVTPACWDALGGQDERLVGWGGDDDQLIAAATCLVGVVRHPGCAVSLWHADANRWCNDENRKIAHRYWEAVGNPDAMRQLIERHR